MTKVGYSYARQIHEGNRTFESVPEKYKQCTIDAYYDLYGINIGE